MSDSDKGLFSISTENNKFINLWNSIEVYTKHRIDTKLYDRIVNYLDSILEGTFDRPLDHKWMKVSNITNHFKKPITTIQIIDAILTYEKQFNPEYYPENKSKLPRSFADFLYNPVTKTSQLLYVLSGNVHKIDSVEPDKYRDLLPDNIANYVDTIIKHKAPKISSKKRQKAYIATLDTIKAHKALVDTLKPYYSGTIAFDSYIGNQHQFFALWYTYLTTQPELYDYMFAPKGFVWYNFLSSLERDHNISLSTDPKDLQRVAKPKKTFEEVVKDDEDILNVYANKAL